MTTPPAVTLKACIAVDDMSELQRIAARLGDQDNLCTSYVCFCVQKQTLISGIDKNYCEADELMWIHQGEAMCESHWPIITKADEDGAATVTLDGEEYDMEDLESTGFHRDWETVQICFTREGAENYIKVNGHNLSKYGPPRIYGESFHRNVEMMTLHRILPALAAIAAAPGRAPTVIDDAAVERSCKAFWDADQYAGKVEWDQLYDKRNYRACMRAALQAALGEGL